MKDEWNPPIAMLIFFVYGAIMGWLLTTAGSWDSQTGIAALGVAVALINTTVLAYIGYQANRLVMSGHARDKARVTNQIRLSLARLSPEWQAARVQVGVISVLLNDALKVETYAARRVARDFAAQHASQINLSETEAILDQLNVLPGPLVDRIGHAIGCVKSIKRAANQGAALETPGARQNMFGETSEPDEATGEALDLFRPAYRVMYAGVRMLDGELSALIDAAHVSFEGTSSR